jgi:hypothetical protein
MQLKQAGNELYIGHWPSRASVLERLPMSAHSHRRVAVAFGALLRNGRDSGSKPPGMCNLLCRRTAGCGPVCPVVWQGSAGNAHPIPIYERGFGECHVGIQEFGVIRTGLKYGALENTLLGSPSQTSFPDNSLARKVVMGMLNSTVL